MGTGNYRPKVECLGTWSAIKGWQIKTLKIRSNVQSIEMNFDWSWAAETEIRPDFLRLISDLASRLCVYDQDDKSLLSLPNFVANLQGLQFENLEWQRDTGNECVLELTLVYGSLADFFTTQIEKNSSDPVAEVFLPLTNLAAYLHAMSDRNPSQGTAQSLSQTAERIDEFLLIYGNRLRDDPVVPLHSFRA